jgi:hypothetical protein
MKVYTVSRPYLIDFVGGGRYPLTSEEAQRLIDSYPVVSANRTAVTLRGDDGRKTRITPATLGGGPAFVVEK